MAKKLTTAQFIEKAIKIHGNKFDYSLTNYKQTHANIKIICVIHGYFLQTPGNHLQGSGCPKCANIRRIVSNSKNSSDFIAEANLIHNHKYDYSNVEYINAYTNVVIFCPIHGKTNQQPTRHLNSSGCPYCGASTRSISKTNNLVDVISKCCTTHNNKYDYSLVKYVNNYTKIIIVCPNHGIFAQTPNSHTQGAGCPKCSKHVSKKENTWLNYHNIPDNPDSRQVYIKINNIGIRVDGFNPSTNTIYEFWGDFWHGNPKVHHKNSPNVITKCTFGELYERTQYKRQLILSGKYNLIEIWEDEWDDNLHKYNNITEEIIC